MVNTFLGPAMCQTWLYSLRPHDGPLRRTAVSERWDSWCPRHPQVHSLVPCPSFCPSHIPHSSSIWLSSLPAGLFPRIFSWPAPTDHSGLYAMSPALTTLPPPCCSLPYHPVLPSSWHWPRSEIPGYSFGCSLTLFSTKHLSSVRARTLPYVPPGSRTRPGTL